MTQLIFIYANDYFLTYPICDVIYSKVFICVTRALTLCIYELEVVITVLLE